MLDLKETLILKLRYRTHAALYVVPVQQVHTQQTCLRNR